MPPPKKSIEHMIVRTDTLKAFEQSLKQPGLIVVDDMEGPYGVGKTTMLTYFYERVSRLEPTPRMAWIDLAQYELQPGSGNKPDEQNERESSETAAEQHERRLEAQGFYKRLLKVIGKELLADLEQSRALDAELDDAHDAPMSELRQQYKSTTQGGNTLLLFSSVRHSDVRAGGARSEGVIPQEDIAHALINGRHRVTSVFGNHVNDLTQKEPIYIFLDNFCHIQDSKLEDWILEELIPELRNCKIVVGRTDYQHRLTPIQNMISRLPIRGFTSTENREYVEKRLGQEALDTGWDEAIYRYSQGHPLSTELLVDIIKTRRLHMAHDPNAWHFLDQIQPDDKERIAALAQELVDSMERQNEYMGRAIDAVCILRDFDGETLVKVVDPPIPETELPRVMALLSRMPMIATMDDHLTVHEFFADVREEWLNVSFKPNVLNLHQRAAGYYGALLHQTEDATTEQTVWQRWHRYETPEWQFLSRHWLYHLCQTPEAGLEIATRYFDAFFWWAEYIPFPYCERLLADLNQANLLKPSREWLDLLKSFHEHFRPVRLRSADTGWASPARLALRDIQSLAGLNRAAEDDAVRWHLKALTDYYMAETHRAEDVHKPEAERFYLQSIQAVEKAEAHYRKRLEDAAADQSVQQSLRAQLSNERWCHAWILNRLAGLHAEVKRQAQALQLSREAEDLIMEVDSEDLETQGLIHLTRADAYFVQADWPEAQREYALYALYALGFLAGDYDFYALEFFREMIERIAQRLCDLQKREPDVLAQWWSALVQFWGDQADSVLPPDIASASTPIEQDTAIEFDEFGHVLSHHLPLPELPLRPVLPLEVSKWSYDLSLRLATDYQAKADDAFHTILERLPEGAGAMKRQ